MVDKASFYRLIKPTFPEYEKSGRHFRGTDAILDRWNSDRRLKDPRWLAYILATSYHETARQMFPVREHLATSDKAALRIFRENEYYQNKTYWRKSRETGEHYFGRGYVQLTWDYNYKRADLRFDIRNRKNSFYWHPSNALNPVSATDITYDGMVYGWFTGHCLLLHFQPNRRADWINARRIINGLDRADAISSFAIQFLEAINQSLRQPNVGEGPEIDVTATATVTAAAKDPLPEPTVVEMEVRAVRNLYAQTDETPNDDQGDTNQDDPSATGQAESSAKNKVDEIFKKLHEFFIWISPVLSCLVWLLAKIAWILATVLEWVSDALIALSEWFSQISENGAEAENN